VVTFYTRRGCHLCDDALRVVEAVRRTRTFALNIVDIDADEALRIEYGHDVPVIVINGEEAFWHRVKETEFLERLNTG
jgi:glutaredoxin